MKVILIQEHLQGREGIIASISFDYGPEYPITISNPFSEAEEQELAWYFEKRLEFPFTTKVRTQNAATSITAYGAALFKQVFGDPDVYAYYRELLKSSLNNVHFAIAGTPLLH